jgi:hypothetical protein
VKAALLTSSIVRPDESQLAAVVNIDVRLAFCIDAPSQDENSILVRHRETDAAILIEWAPEAAWMFHVRWDCAQL